MPGTDINAYQGNPNLGQGTAGSAYVAGVYEPKYTNDALDKLTLYHFYEKRDQWARDNILKDAEAAQVAKDLTFKLGDFLPKDNTSILEKIGEFNKFYIDHPDAVKLITDKTGRIVNGEEHTAWLNMRSEIDSMIERANGRRSQADKVLAQVGGFTDPTKRKNGEDYYNRMLNSPITDDIMLFPDVTVWNPKSMTLTPIEYSTSQTLPNYITSTKYKLADVNAGLDNFLIQLNVPANEDMRGTVNGFMTQYNGIINKVKAEHPDVTDERQFRDLVAAEKGGDAIVSLYDNMNGYLDHYNSEGVQAYTKRPTVQPIKLTDNVDEREMGLLMLTNNLINTQETEQKYTGAQLEKYGIDMRYKESMAEIAAANQRNKDQIEAQKEVAGLKNGVALASDKANLFMDILNTPLKGNAQQDKYGFVIPVDQMMENIFHKELPQPVVVSVPNDPNELEKGASGYTKKTYDSYQVSSIRLSPAADGDPDKSTITVFYRDPQTGKVRSDLTQTYSPQRFWNLANNLYGFADADKVSKASSDYLKKEFGLEQPDFQTMANKFAEGTGLGGTTQAEPLPATNGKIDVKLLQEGKTYTYNGNTYIWKGGKLVPVK